MKEINQIKSQLKDKGINPNGVLGKSNSRFKAGNRKFKKGKEYN